MIKKITESDRNGNPEATKGKNYKLVSKTTRGEFSGMGALNISKNENGKFNSSNGRIPETKCDFKERLDARKNFHTCSPSNL
ncbi:MAG: hypothetical protein EPN85_08875 [Bacteroidetes bacterium]|nr:MAG: hypothetical protein EPN85_08875 [Bacteroidota bacterium]